MGEFLSPQQLAELVGVPLGTVRKWRSRGEGPAAHKVGNAVRYSRVDVNEWLAACREP